MGASFTVTISRIVKVGNQVHVHGKYVNAGGGTGGDITTNLHVVESCLLQEWGSAAITSAAAVNEAFPLAGGDVTIVTAANTSGSFLAIGRY